MLLLLMEKQIDTFNDKISLNRKDLIIFIYFICFIAISARLYLNDYLSQDELSYIGSAFHYPRKILSSVNLIPSTYDSNIVIQSLAFIILIINLSFIKILMKISFRNQIKVICFTTVSLYTFLSVSGAYINGYSKINVLPYNIFGSVFGISPIIFRITTICLVSITLAFICKFLKSL